MDYSHSFAISAAGMDLERLRVDVSALNLANAHAAWTQDGVRYQPLHVVASSVVPTAHFASLMGSAIGVPAATVQAGTESPRQVYEPGHPAADGQGFVRYPGVDTAVEMMTLMSATRAYEANVAALNAARSMALKALDIGGAA